jgi:hypothetical protein
MRLRLAVFAAAIALAMPGAASLAADSSTPSPLAPVGSIFQAIAGTPDGWTRNMDGSYKNPASGVLCPSDFKSFTFDNFQSPAAGDTTVVGICHYRDGAGRVGTIRVRKPGPVTDPEGTIADIDKQLMATDGSAPPMLMRASTDRKTGGSRLTVTVFRNGYLVDCSVVHIEHNVPRGDFPLYCTTLTGPSN